MKENSELQTKIAVAQRPEAVNSGKRVRSIPRLDIKGPNLVKGVHLEGLRVLGRPEPFARHYYENGADELVFMDVVASLYGRNSLVDVIRSIAREIFVPLTVGGGLRNTDDIRSALRAGADKVALNTAAIRRPEFVREAARKFGSSTIVVSIEAIKRSAGRYEAYTDNGRERTGIDAFEWAVRAAELGAGEILVTSIEREGTGEGFDLELARTISEAVPIPVIVPVGAGTLEHIFDVAVRGKTQAICLASMLHYNFCRNPGLLEGIDPTINTAHLQRGRFERVNDTSLAAVKSFLLDRGIDCRPVETIRR